MRGAYTPLRHKRAQLGWILRSKVNCNPLVVSPGHRVSMASAADLVMRFTAKYRLPEPTRLADRLASRRDEDQGLKHRPRSSADNALLLLIGRSPAQDLTHACIPPPTPTQVNSY